MIPAGGCEIDVPLNFFAEIRIPRPCWALRRTTALLGIFAILLQAMLFAWHHHAHPLSSPGAPAVVAAAAATGDQIPASADDECQICFALTHHGAVPVDLFTPAPADHLPVLTPSAAAVAGPLAPYLLFRSRAPPRA
jgi:hypothetical protein